MSSPAGDGTIRVLKIRLRSSATEVQEARPRSIVQGSTKFCGRKAKYECLNQECQGVIFAGVGGRRELLVALAQ